MESSEYAVENDGIIHKLAMFNQKYRKIPPLKCLSVKDFAKN